MRDHRRLLAPVLFVCFSLLVLYLAYGSFRQGVEGQLDLVLPSQVAISSSLKANYVAFDLEDVASGEVIHNAIGQGQAYVGDGVRINLLESDFVSFALVSVDVGEVLDSVRLIPGKSQLVGGKRITVTGFVVDGD